MRARFADRKTDFADAPEKETANLEAQSTGSSAPTLSISAASPFARCWSVANRRKFEMNERQRREIAESAFKRQFSDVESFRIDAHPGFDLEDDSPVVDVNTVYDNHTGEGTGSLLHPGLVPNMFSVMVRKLRHRRYSARFSPCFLRQPTQFASHTILRMPFRMFPFPQTPTHSKTRRR